MDCEPPVPLLDHSNAPQGNRGKAHAGDERDDCAEDSQTEPGTFLSPWMQRRREDADTDAENQHCAPLQNTVEVRELHGDVRCPTARTGSDRDCRKQVGGNRRHRPELQRQEQCGHDQYREPIAQSGRQQQHGGRPDEDRHENVEQDERCQRDGLHRIAHPEVRGSGQGAQDLQHDDRAQHGQRHCGDHPDCPAGDHRKVGNRSGVEGFGDARPHVTVADVEGHEHDADEKQPKQAKAQLRDQEPWPEPPGVSAGKHAVGVGVVDADPECGSPGKRPEHPGPDRPSGGSKLGNRNGEGLVETQPGYRLFRSCRQGERILRLRRRRVAQDSVGDNIATCDLRRRPRPRRHTSCTTGRDSTGVVVP